MPWSPDRNKLLSKKRKSGNEQVSIFPLLSGMDRVSISRLAEYGNFLTGSWPIGRHHFMKTITWYGRTEEHGAELN